MQEIKSQWMKRVNVTQLIYSYLIFPIRSNKFIEICLDNYNFDANQIKIIEYFLTNKSEIEKQVNKYVKAGWNFERLNTVDQAIIYCAISEKNTLNTDKNIIIDESVKTAKNFSDIDSYEFINAILDKIL
ncbi:MAG: transcription antitermination protein NusB [Ureaplasma sp.]|nr:transcription antitermination protein NusB [Ureaplasma sp.]